VWVQGGSNTGSNRASCPVRQNDEDAPLPIAAVRHKVRHMATSVVLQARVPSEVAELLSADIDTLGLEGTSDAIRQALHLLHRQARMVALGQAYDAFYDGSPAPLSEVTSALYPDEEN